MQVDQQQIEGAKPAIPRPAHLPPHLTQNPKKVTFFCSSTQSNAAHELSHPLSAVVRVGHEHALTNVATAAGVCRADENTPQHGWCAIVARTFVLGGIHKEGCVVP